MAVKGDDGGCLATGDSGGGGWSSERNKIKNKKN